LINIGADIGFPTAFAEVKRMRAGYFITGPDAPSA
jgi:hypothetical protein